MRQASRSFKARRDTQTRKHLMERSFARSKRFGFDRARWRGLWRVQIQEYLTCVIQGVQALVRYGHSSKKSPLVFLQQIKQIIAQAIQAGSYEITSLLPRIPSENAHVFVGHRNWSLATFE